MYSQWFSEEEIVNILQTHSKFDIYEDVMIKLRQFEVRDTDVFLIGYPKSGTTWAQEMIWLIANDLNYNGAKKFIDERFPVLDTSTFKIKNRNVEIPEYHEDSLRYLEKLKHPRFIKTHAPIAYLPAEIKNRSKKPKIIYIARNVKDVCVSYHYYMRNILKCLTCDLNDFCKIFMAGKVLGGDYWSGVLYFWERRDEENVLFLRYEDMKKDLSAVIRQVATFLDKTLNEEQVSTLIKWLDFESMKKNPALNHDDLYKQSGFIRKGKVGGFKDDMSEEWIERFDQWTKHHLQGSGLDM